MTDGHHFVPRRRLTPLRGILEKALRAHGMTRRLPRRIAPEVWELAVGKQIAARAQPTVLTGGTLHVLVQDHRWRDQLDAARNFVVERINRRLGAGTVWSCSSDSRTRARCRKGGAGRASGWCGRRRRWWSRGGCWGRRGSSRCCGRRC